MQCGTSVKISLILASGILLGLIGGIIYAVFPVVFRKQVEKNAVISESNKKVFEAWKLPPVPVYFKVYYFNVTNAEDFEYKSAKPILKELGPYVFKEVRKKKDIKFSDDGEHVWFRNKKSFAFEPELSNGTLQDKITTLNIPLISITKKVQSFPIFLKTLVSTALSFYSEELFITKTVSELGFDGYKQLLVQKIQQLTSLKLLPNATFGLFYESKISDDGLYKINTGRSDPKKFTVLQQWNNQSKLSFWNSPYCNMINGTDGSMFPPFVDKAARMYTFSTDLCRSIYTVYSKDVMHYGIKTYRFIAPEELFGDPNTYEPNKCYCVTKTCFGKGLLDISKCKQGAPIVMSAPHFYQGGQNYVDAVIGMNPSKEKHETYLDIEPDTGIVMDATKRVQINVDLQPIPGLKSVAYVNETIFPIVWIEEGAVIDSTSAQKFKDIVKKPKLIVTILLIVLVSIGTILLLAATIFAICTRNKINVILKPTEPQRIQNSTNHNGRPVVA